MPKLRSSSLGNDLDLINAGGIIRSVVTLRRADGSVVERRRRSSSDAEDLLGPLAVRRVWNRSRTTTTTTTTNSAATLAATTRKPPMPVLTTILIRLESSTKSYCKGLAQPSTVNIIGALRTMIRLNVTTAATTTTSGNTSVSSDPKTPPLAFKDSPPTTTTTTKTTTTTNHCSQNHSKSNGLPTELTLSPKSLRMLWTDRLAHTLSWSPSSSSSQKQSPNHRGTAVTNTSSSPYSVEGEKDKFVTPFLVLAMAEAFYNQMEHLYDDGDSDYDYHDTDDDSNVYEDGKTTHVDHDCTCDTSRWPGDFLQSLFNWRKAQAFVAVDNNDDGGVDQNEFVNQHKLGGVARKKNESYHPIFRSTEKAVRLTKMYKFAVERFRHAQEQLCDPITGSAVLETSIREESTSSDSPKDNDAYEAAMSLRSTLDALIVFASTRRTLILLHCGMFRLRPTPSSSSTMASQKTLKTGHEYYDDGDDVGPIDLLHLGRSCNALLASLPTTTKTSLRSGDEYGETTINSHDTRGSGKTQQQQQQQGPSIPCGDALPMVESIRNEIEALLVALTVCQSVNRCNFFESVLGLRKLETRLKNPSFPPPPLQLWLSLVVADALSKMSIYFDKVRSCTGRHHGFRMPDDPDKEVADGDGNIHMNPHGTFTVENYDKLVVDFLDQTSSLTKGQPSDLALAVILEEPQQKRSVEQGFVCGGGEGKRQTLKKKFIYSGPSPYFARPPRNTADGNDREASWPAVYLRTNIVSSEGEPISTSSSSDLMDPLSLNRDENDHARGGTDMDDGWWSNVDHPQYTATQERTAYPFRLQRPRYVDDFEKSTSIDGPNRFVSKNRGWPLEEWPDLINALMQKSAELKTTKAADVVAFGGGSALMPHHPQLNSSGSGGRVVMCLRPFTFRRRRLEPSKLLMTGRQPHARHHNLHHHHQPHNGSYSPSDHTHTRGRPLQQSTQWVGYNPLNEPTHMAPAPSVVRPDDGERRAISTMTAYHAVQVDRHSWVVVLERNGSSEPAGNSSDVEIRSFLHSFSTRLRSDHLFSAKVVSRARKESRAFELRSNNAHANTNINTTGATTSNARGESPEADAETTKTTTTTFGSSSIFFSQLWRRINHLDLEKETVRWVHQVKKTVSVLD